MEAVADADADAVAVAEAIFYANGLWFGWGIPVYFVIPVHAQEPK